MALQPLGSTLRRYGAVALVLGLAFSFCAPAVAGLIGAVGDVYVGSNGGGIFQYDGATGAFVGVFASVPGTTFLGQAWGPDGDLYAAGTSQAGFGNWDVFHFDGNTGALLGTVVSYHVGDFSLGKCITFGPDGDLYLDDWAKFQIQRYDGTDFSAKASYQGAPGVLGTPNGMTFTADGRLLVISGGAQQVVQFDTSADGVSLIGPFAGPFSAAQAQDLTFGPNGNLFVSGGNSGGVMEFDGASGAFVGDFVPPGAGNTGLVFDDYGRLLVSTNESGNARVVEYDAVTGDLLGDFFPAGSGGMGVPGFLTIKPVPEPATLSLLLVGGIALLRRRR
jgi:streptogramin lyase